MLALLLGILKIAGIILLTVLGIVLLLILLVLLVPIRYRMEGTFDGTPAGLAKVTWLLHLISVKAEYREVLDIAVKVLGFRVFGIKLPEDPDTGPKADGTAEESSGAGENADQDVGAGDSKEKISNAEGKRKGAKNRGQKKNDRENGGRAKKDGKVKAETKAESKADGLKKIVRVEQTFDRETANDIEGSNSIETSDNIETCDNIETHDNIEIPDNNIETLNHVEISNDIEQINSPEESQPQISPSFLTGIYDKVRERCVGTVKEILQKIRSAVAAAREKIQAIRDKKEWAVAFLKNEENQKTFRLMKRQVFCLIRHILPQKLSGRLRFGFDDPGTTGQVLTYISPFYGFYAGRLELIPVFEEKTLEGEVSLKGRVRILTILWIAVRMLFDRNFRKLIRWFLDRER